MIHGRFKPKPQPWSRSDVTNETRYLTARRIRRLEMRTGEPEFTNTDEEIEELKQLALLENPDLG